MGNLLKFLNSNFFTIAFVCSLALTRVIPHPPNFTPIIAMAILLGFYCKDIYFSFLILGITMLLSDLVLGFHGIMPFVYFSLFIITFLSFSFKTKINIKSLLIFGFFSSCIFFLVSNFGVWLVMNYYPKNFTGLMECYVLAIPFFKNTVISSIFYSYLAFIILVSIKKYKNTRKIIY